MGKPKKPCQLRSSIRVKSALGAVAKARFDPRLTRKQPISGGLYRLKALWHYAPARPAESVFNRIIRKGRASVVLPFH
jgi:hypothetical protein